jgi:ABC-type branched-subunit amino acid transport system ATPase component
VDGATASFETIAAREAELGQAVERLPGALDATNRAMTGTRELAGDLEPALSALRPTIRGLAPALVDVVFETLATIRERGVTVLLVEQRAQRTVAFADRTYVLANGELRLTLTHADAADTNTMIAAYLA